MDLLLDEENKVSNCAEEQKGTEMIEKGDESNINESHTTCLLEVDVSKGCENEVDKAKRVILEINGSESVTMSKNQMKKLKRKMEWEATKEERRKKQREKVKIKRQLKREAGKDLGPSRKALKSASMSSSLCKQRLVIDMSFDEYMSERDACKAVKQVQRCYSSNRRVENPSQFYITSLGGPSLKIMERNNGFRNWNVFVNEKSYSDLFKLEDLVYLSSDSDNVIDVLDDEKVYIIGGLVDHNYHKGLCHKIAVDNKIAHAKLPIGKYMQMKTREVLTIDQVFRIMLSVCSEKKSWEDAFVSAIPTRKGGTLLNEQNESEDSGDESPSQDL